MYRMKVIKKYKPQLSRTLQKPERPLKTCIDNGVIKYSSWGSRLSLYDYIEHTHCVYPNQIIQRCVRCAQNFRHISNNIVNNVHANFNNSTVGVSENFFAITPMLRGNRQRLSAINASGNRIEAPAVPNADFRIGNHAERKLIFHDVGRRNIGVNRAICQSCVNAICTDYPQLNHVSEPGVTYLVTPLALIGVAH